MISKLSHPPPPPPQRQTGRPGLPPAEDVLPVPVGAAQRPPAAPPAPPPAAPREQQVAAAAAPATRQVRVEDPQRHAGQHHRGVATLGASVPAAPGVSALQVSGAWLSI